ncbi:MAG TPA: hypothetical protein VKE40_08320 [Gemmataceae bacterium]|nr:hypothetical protein [Gemmataceae bacterium]
MTRTQHLLICCLFLIALLINCAGCVAGWWYDVTTERPVAPLPPPAAAPSGPADSPAPGIGGSYTSVAGPVEARQGVVAEAP